MALGNSLEILLFGDETEDVRVRLEELYRRSKSSVLLSKFLHDSINGINAAAKSLTGLSPAGQAVLSAKDFLQLDDAPSDLILPRAVTLTLLSCITQLGSALLCADKDPSILGEASAMRVCGLGLGMLPAVAVYVASSVTELLAISPEIVSLSLRLALAVSLRAQSVEEEPGSWSLFVPKMSSDSLSIIIEKFNNANRLPSHRHVYISAMSRNGSTVSGPPSSLHLLLSHGSGELRSATPLKSSLSGPYHASHLPLPALDSILGESKFLDRRLNPESHLLSTSSGNCFTGCHDVRTLIKKCLVDILQLPLDFKSLGGQFQGLALDQRIDVTSVGPSTFAADLQSSIRYLSAHRDPLIPDTHPQNEEIDGAVAIVGMSGRFPGADSPDELWELFVQGVETHKEIPKDRFDVRTHCDPSGEKRNTTLTPYGCFIERPDLFDAHLFKMSAREAAQTDPIHRLMLMTAYEALEMAGYSAEDSNNNTFATYYGQSSDDWREVNAGQNIDIFHITGGNRAFGPGRINYFFGWEGPSMNIDAACSASALSIQLACTALKSRECDTALAGGANILTASDIFAGLSRGGFLSPTGSCKTWDAEADGYCRADAVGTVVLKRLDDALKNRDNVLGVVRSTATNHSAKAVSITHPHSETQQRLYERVLQQALVSPKDVDYVEMHGTGTQAGDVAESASVASVFEGIRKHPLYVGASKANVGHGEAASGVTSVIKAVMMIRESLIPKHIGIKGQLNPLLAFKGSKNIRVPFENVLLPPKSGDRRRILINNFNATGGNTSLLLEEGPKNNTEGEDPRPSHVIAISAARPRSLESNIESMIKHLSSSPDINVCDLAYTTTARRIHHKFRVAYVVDDVSLLVQQLQTTPTGTTARTTSAVIFLFTGQSAPLAGAASSLFKTSTSFRRRVESIDSLCQMLGLPSIVKLITEASCGVVAQDPIRSQVGLVALEIALTDQWKTWGLHPTIVMGHSLGEYAALYAAGVLSMSDALYLVGVRAGMMRSKLDRGSHCMMAAKLPFEPTEEALQSSGLSHCEIATINSPTSTVVSGPKPELATLDDNLHSNESDVKTTLLKVPYAFHSAQMDSIVDDFERAAKGVQFRKPNIPVVSTLLAQTVSEEGIFDAHYLARQMREPVQFAEALQTCQDYTNGQWALWFEVGPSPVCVPMVRSTLHISPERLLSSLDSKEENWKTVSRSLAKAYQAGIDIRWREYHKEFEPALTILDLPFYSFDLKSYWLQYEGDWSVRKNQIPVESGPDMPPSLHSTTIHRFEGQIPVEGGTEFMFITDFADLTLNTMAMGHLVNDTALCPSSIYADMAMTVAKYCWENRRPSEKCPVVDVASMEAFKPLIVRSDGTSQPVKIVAKDIQGENQVKVSVESIDTPQTGQHMQCVVNYGQATEWTESWDNTNYLYQGRIDHLVDAASRGKVHRMLKGMVYKLFSSLVKYHENFQMIEEVILDSKMKEATACVSLNSSDGSFAVDPRWIDGLAHLSGFILNGSDETPENTVYISHGWRSMRLAVPLVAGHTYRTYVRMQPAHDRGVFAGDLYIFDGDNTVGVIGGLKSQAIKKSVLTALLPSNPRTTEPPVKPLTAESTGLISDRSTGASSIRTNTIKTPATPEMSSGSGDLAEVFRSIIAQEVGIGIAEIEPRAELVDLGVDSLLTLAIISAFATRTSVQLPVGFIHDNPTFADAKRYFDALSSPESTSSEPGPQDRDNQTRCTFVQLQQPSKPDSPSLFLFPDGSGSASPYLNLPSFSADASVIAFNSPFQTNPNEFNSSLEEAARIYISEISRLEPTGPVFLGGWSIGAAYAYEVAYQMISSGKDVAGLVMIDAIAPRTMSNMPVETLDILDTAGLNKGTKGLRIDGTAHANVQQHFKASIRVLDAYHARPMSEIEFGKTLSCRVIWARRGVFESISQEKREAVYKTHGEQVKNLNSMQEWLLVGRQDFGPHGWDELVGCRVECEVVDAHHFSIMGAPAVKTVGKALDNAIQG